MVSLFSSKNIMVKSHVLDFGLARVVHKFSKQKKMSVVGTERWMVSCSLRNKKEFYVKWNLQAPEVLGGMPYNQLADVFSLGCLYYEFLFRKFPPARTAADQYRFNPKHITEKTKLLYPEQSDDIEILLTGLTSTEPDDRPSCMDVISKLSKLQKIHPIEYPKE